MYGVSRHLRGSTQRGPDRKLSRRRGTIVTERVTDWSWSDDYLRGQFYRKQMGYRSPVRSLVPPPRARSWSYISTKFIVYYSVAVANDIEPPSSRRAPCLPRSSFALMSLIASESSGRVPVALRHERIDKMRKNQNGEERRGRLPAEPPLESPPSANGPYERGAPT